MYGASVTAPMEIPQPLPSYFSQVEMKEMPEIKDATTGTIRLEGTLDKRLPNMPSGDLNDLSLTNSKQLEAMQYMNEMRISYGESRRSANRSRAIAKAKGRQAQRQAERR
jgi:hypothetical protein